LLGFVHGISCDDKYYGIKNRKIKNFTAESCYPIIEEYFIGKSIGGIDFPMKYSSIIG